MNAFNRLIMLLIALLLIAVPVVMLLVAFDYLTGLSPDIVNQYTNYQGGLEALGNLSMSSFDQQARIIAALVSVLVAIVALALLFREIPYGRRLARDTIVEDTPGQETIIKTSAVQSLVRGAIQEAGAAPYKITLESNGRPYNVYCGIQVPEMGDFTEISSRTNENVKNALNLYSVPYRNVEVTVQGTTS